MAKISEPITWHREEAGYYWRQIGLGQVLQIVHKNHTPADHLHSDRWVVRTIVGKPAKITELHRAASYKAARQWADEWLEGR